jgi:2-dehydropantoate 2-reductase
MRVLVVGAGAVGQVYGRHLQLGGADVTFFVRDKYRAATAAGFVLYPLNRRDKAAPIRFDDFKVATSPDEVGSVDVVLLTVSSPALRGSWLASLVAATGGATYVVLQPGLDDRKIVEQAGVSADRIVAGLISLISYHAPLPGETRFPEPGMAYWFPPRAPGLFSGSADRVAAIVATLRAGKQPAKRTIDVAKTAMFPSAVLMPYLVALEAAGWSFRELMRSPHAALGARGAREALAIVGRAYVARVPFGIRLVARRSIIRTGLWFARRVMPLPLETYLEVHFTKVGDQTREIMERYVALGTAAGQSVEALTGLLAALPASASSSPGRVLSS